MSYISFNYPTKIFFGAGSRTLIPGLLKKAGVKRPLIVTDSGVAKLPLLELMTNVLAEGGMESAVYSGIAGNPTAEQVMSGVEAYRAAGADCVVAFGGGAALDAAKCVALMASHPGKLFDYEDGIPNGRPVDRVLPLVIAVPTTAGTGSEVGRSSVISDDETKRKKIVFDPKLLPPYAILDPELTTSLPASLTATTGIDALSHLVEAYLSKGFHPLADGIALEGVRLVSRSLKRCVELARERAGNTSEHLEVRGLMLVASMMGATAFQKGLGVAHSLAHSLSGVADMHHGLAIAITLPSAMEFNKRYVSDRLATLAEAAGCSEISAEGFISWLRELNRTFEVPESLKVAGVSTESFDRLVQFAFEDGCHQCNPGVVTEGNFKELFKGLLEL